MHVTSLHHLMSIITSQDPHPLDAMAIGACTRAFSGFTMLPVTVVKIRFESSQFQNKSVAKLLLSSAEWKASKVCAVALMQHCYLKKPIFWFLFHVLETNQEVCQNIYPDRQIDRNNTLLHLGCGLVVGSPTAIATHPAHVVKTHMQLYPPPSIVILFMFESEDAGFLQDVVTCTL